MSSIQVTINPVEMPDELFCHYSGQHNIQDAFLALSLESGQMWCSYNPEIGNGIPESVWAGRTRSYKIPVLTATAANDLMSRCLELAQRIVDGGRVEWDGNNSVGRLDEDAQAAEDEITQMCAPNSCQWDQSDYVGEWTASDWYSTESADETAARLGLTVDSTDQQIMAMVAEEERCARQDCGASGYVILTGVEEHLTGLRDELVRRRSELAKYTVVTKSPALGSYDSADQGLALEYEGVWQCDLSAAGDAVAKVADEVDVEATTISLVPGQDSYTGELRWTFTLR